MRRASDIEVGGQPPSSLVTQPVKQATAVTTAAATQQTLPQPALRASHSLSAVNLHRVNFTGCKFVQSTFCQTFGGILAVAFSPDSKMLALADTDSTVRLWQTISDNESGVEQLLSSLSGHQSWVLAVAWHPNKPRLISGSEDCTIKIWNVETGQCLHTLRDHQKGVWSLT